jgi:Flp pilus assembly protein TadD
VRLGVELGRQGRNAEALEQFGEAVRIRPGMMEAKLNLGIALWKQQRSEEALVQFKEVLEKDPTNAIALRYLQSLPPSIPAAPP